MKVLVIARGMGEHTHICAYTFHSNIFQTLKPRNHSEQPPRTHPLKLKGKCGDPVGDGGEGRRLRDETPKTPPPPTLPPHETATPTKRCREKRARRRHKGTFLQVHPEITSGDFFASLAFKGKSGNSTHFVFDPICILFFSI